MLIYSVVLLLLLGGAAASLVCKGDEARLKAVSGSVFGASVLGFVMSVILLAMNETRVMNLPLPLPLGRCVFSVDSLCLVFLIPVFLLSGASALLLPERLRRLAAEAPLVLRIDRHCFFYCLLILSMVLVLMAADAVFFVISWELMSLAPFFLISPADRDSRERAALWTYLVAAHLGALVLLYLFASLSVGADSTDFLRISARAAEGAIPATGLLFVLALVGFGVKAGLVPLHMWMPEAHSSAPGHVAVLLSGTMLNLGLYGILRLMVMLGEPQIWWAYTLMGAGAFSGIIGILLGLAQTDMKRTLAYSSAENMGIICLGFGAGLLAGLNGAREAMYLLYGGALLHMWNHSIFKSLLFLAANALKESIHDTRIHLLGGLQKRLPVTGTVFAVGSAAIAGAPPLNGFMSELLLYVGFASAALALHGQDVTIAFWAGFFVLATIAGLAVFTFTRTYGLVFLGEPRSRRAAEAVEPEPGFRRVMIFFALLCCVVPLIGPALYLLLEPCVEAVALLTLGPAAGPGHFPEMAVLGWYALGCLLVAALLAAFLFLRRRLVRENGAAPGVTWDCGYLEPGARMQYSAASFSNTLTAMLRPLVRDRVDMPAIRDLFPPGARLKVDTPDWPTLVWDKLVFRPFLWLGEMARGLQAGLVNVYVLYIFVALVAALVYALGGAS